MSAFSVHIDSEIENARKLHKKGILIMRNVLVEIAKGQRIDVFDLHQFIDDIICSLSRNPHALLCLTKNKQVTDYLILHCFSSCILNTAFAIAQEMDLEDVKALALGGMLADVGKFRVPKDLLYKEKKFNNNDYALIKNHVKLSAALAERIHSLPELTLQAIVEHHEKVDGSGYPEGKTADEISLAGKMTSIVDVFDAFTSEQFHRCAEEPTDTLKKMMSMTATHFDKSLLQQFIQMVGIYPVGTLVILNNGQLAVVIDQHPVTLLAPTVRTLYDIRKKELILDRQDLFLNDSDVSIVTHAKPDKYKINGLTALG